MWCTIPAIQQSCIETREMYHLGDTIWEYRLRGVAPSWWHSHEILKHKCCTILVTQQWCIEAEVLLSQSDIVRLKGTIWYDIARSHVIASEIWHICIFVANVSVMIDQQGDFKTDVMHHPGDTTIMYWNTRDVSSWWHNTRVSNQRCCTILVTQQWCIEAEVLHHPGDTARGYICIHGRPDHPKSLHYCTLLYSNIMSWSSRQSKIITLPYPIVQ